MKKSIFGIIICFVSLLINFNSCKSNEKNPSPETVEKVKLELARFSDLLPIEGGVGMIITDIDYDDASNTIRYKYQYTVPGVSKPDESQIKEAKKAALTLVESMPREKELLMEGISYHYDYYTMDNTYLYSMDISLHDLENK